MYCKTSDGLNIYYERYGKGNPGTIVFLNGLTQSTLAWSLMMPFFIGRDVVLIDFIFQGKSDKEGEWRTFDEHAEDVKAVLANEGIKKANIAGLSYGSMVAQHLAVNHPRQVDRLVLISTFAHKTPYYEAIELSWRRALESGGYNLLLDIMMPTVLSEDYFSNPLIPIQAMKEARKELNQSNEAILKLMKATVERDDYRPELKKIKSKTLVIQGEKDLLLPVHMAQEVASNILKAEMVVIPNAGHTLNLERCADVAQHIQRFLR